LAGTAHNRLTALKQLADGVAGVTRLYGRFG